MERAGGWYHVTARGNERRRIFRDDVDRAHFCALLGELVERFGLRLHAFVLMDNHYHLLLELTEANLSRAGQWLNLSYGVWFNRRHGRAGHLFQGRFQSVAVDPLGWGLELSRYVHLNPVRVGRLGLGKRDRSGLRAGLSGAPRPEQVRERLAELRGYRWSSYRAYIGLSQGPAWLTCERVWELGGRAKAGRAAAYREYVEDAVREGLARRPWEELSARVILGGAQFVAQLRGKLKGNARAQPGLKRLGPPRPTLETIIAHLEGVRGQRWEEFRDRYGDAGRDLVLYLGRRVCGLKLGELARRTGMKDYSAAWVAIRRYECRLRRSAADREQVKQLRQMSKVEM
jgi:REP element-mobilizing transposase RayT